MLNNQGRFVIISGPSGSGKTTLHKMLLESPRLKGKLVKSISATTRHKRTGERHGRDYLFLTPAMFENRLAKKYFLEWEKVFDNYYGTPKVRALNLLKKGKHVLLCIDVKGARTVCSQYPKALKIFIKTPTLSVLEDRLKKRASETSENLKLRLGIARQELKEAKKYDHVIINARLDQAARDLEKLVCQELGLEG